jgi:hypothetical protein
MVGCIHDYSEDSAVKNKYKILLNETKKLQISNKRILGSVAILILFISIGLILSKYLDNDAGVIVGTLFSVSTFSKLVTELHYRGRIRRVINMVEKAQAEE